MKAIKYLVLGGLFLPSAAIAQNAVDAMTLMQQDLRGTARFMSMAGAFGALGGDLSTLTQNPAGIGVYRSSDIGITMDIDVMSAKTDGRGGESADQTKVYCPNFGYVGSWKTSSATMPFFNWGVSYGRVASLDRHFSASGVPQTARETLSSYVAGFTTKGEWTVDELLSGQGSYNPYRDSYAPWMSILGYNGMLINPIGNNTYQGITQNTGSSTASFDVVQKGYIDEYSINFGGNIVNTVYWGIGIGIKDVDMHQWVNYGESVTGGELTDYDTSTHTYQVEGNIDGAYNLSSDTHVWGSGVDVKLGVIVKPVNELRLGFAVHTPTWYSLNYNEYSTLSGNFANNNVTVRPSTWTNDGQASYNEFRFDSPWKIMVSAAGVLGNKGIVSVDYEYDAYNKMKLKGNAGWCSDADFNYANADINNYTTGVSTLRLGAEYRVTSAFSVRAGYSYSTSPVKSEADVARLNSSADTRMDTGGFEDTGTCPSYTLNRDTQYVTLGLGYRFQMFYIDAAYVWRHRSADYYGCNAATPVKVGQNDNNIVLSAGLRF